jgi:hypothetical protein
MPVNMESRQRGTMMHDDLPVRQSHSSLYTSCMGPACTRRVSDDPMEQGWAIDPTGATYLVFRIFAPSLLQHFLCRETLVHLTTMRNKIKKAIAPMGVTYIFEIIDDREVKCVWLRHDGGSAPTKTSTVLVRVQRKRMAAYRAPALVDRFDSGIVCATHGRVEQSRGRDRSG